MNSRNELVDLTLFIHHTTGAAILVSDDGTEKRAVWLPKSQVEVEMLKSTGSELGEAIVTMPLWLATEKRLV